jgi:hypothetical protein
MEKLIGENVCPKTDIINKHRNEFKQALLDKMSALVNGKIKNQKR